MSCLNTGEAAVAVATYHYDNLRTGWNSSETNLTASTFPPHFGVIATVAARRPGRRPTSCRAGCEYKGSDPRGRLCRYRIQFNLRNRCSSGQILVQTNLGPPVPEPLGCSNNGPNVGITGTPVIDVKARLLFVIAYVNLTPSGSTPTPGYQLHRLNLLTLQDTVPPVTITASQTLADGSTYTVQRGLPTAASGAA